MDKFGGIFNITLSDLPRLLKSMGIGASDKDQQSLRKLQIEASKQMRDFERFDDKLRRSRKHLTDDVNRQMTAIRNKMETSKETARKKFEERVIEDELRKTGIFTKTLDAIKDLKHGGILNRMVDFALGKGLVASIGGVIGVFTSVFQTLNSVIDDTGFLSNHVLNNFIDMRREMETMLDLGHKFNVTTATHLTIATELAKTHGEIADVSVLTLDSIANLEYTLGVTNQEAIGFLDTFRGITGQSVETNLELLKTTALLASRHNVPFRAMMEDVSSNSELFAGNIGKGSEEMLRSVIYARRMGIELSSMMGVLDSFQNIENVVETSLQLSLITGRQINFLDSASQAFAGNTEEAMKSLLQQIQLVDDATFNIPFVRRQFAEQLGVSTEELNRMRQALDRFGVDDTFIDFDLGGELESFSDLMSGFGFRRLRIEAQRNILQPINSAMDRHIEQATRVVDAGVAVTEQIGKFTEWYFDKLGIAGTILPAIVGGFARLAQSGAVQTGLQAGLLKQVMAIRKQTLWNSLTSPVGGKGGLARGVRMGGAVGVGGGLALSSMGQATDNSMLTGAGILTGMLGGAIAGSGLGIAGIAGGAILGGLTAGIPAMIGSGLASGGIVTKEMIQPIAERNQKEAVIPLESSRGKEMMQLDLSEKSINSLVNKMKERGLSPTINFHYNGRRVDDDEKFFEMIASSG